MKQLIFSIPIFTDKVDLDLISKISDEATHPSWLAQVPTTIGEDHNIPDETMDHLIGVIARNLKDLVGPNPRLEGLWRTKYQAHDWQDLHIHPRSSWSFIIYESVPESKTVFMNPSYKDIQNHMGCNVPEFPLDYRPQLETGSIIIFPSFLQHFVCPGNIGSTIAGNISMDYD